MELKIFTDGGALNNPGTAASAFVVYSNKKILHQEAFAIGSNTNNFAEYTAVVKAYEWLLKNKPIDIAKINFYSDSNLIVNQLNGLFKIKNAVIREFVLKIRSLEQELNVPVTYRYIPREENQLADSLVKKILYSPRFPPARE
ncbi:hypothetical protein A2954_05395 [Candidatus Roizmanbacteria bacterium RIFCSPLOWO2_01_FULL_37_12]|uniref:RNase H type-1 domain-containing protein n=1 Tax=Candidatus Roizmanbacteria bacterium RIFCSPLOWO2_01_FULL_37_12 TaxID=1802056 RepID=A0A1F7IDH0_9BACT|nr:MAG: hypothetical protein A2954_05395 [Candidatus Roizmanbacteria bacterium RIFCSPLOWO2_01_FULL_37_12]